MRFGILIAVIGWLASAVVVANESAPGISWPPGQALPHLATPRDGLDAIDIQSLSRDEQLTYAALQGLVNKRQPRIWLVNQRSEEGWRTWLETLSWRIERRFDNDDKHELIAKYADTPRGVVLYDPSQNPHLRNIATTVAGLREGLPMTADLHGRLTDQGIALPVIEDLTDLQFEGPIEAYEHLYRVYWPACEKRFLLSARPYGRGGDYHHTRDLVAACGAATVWLDCRKPAERALFGKFLADMPAEAAVVLGWHASERSGVTTASEYGVGTVPSDHFMNATVFSGGDHQIQTPSRPETPPLENKLYATIIISDGDNAQYTQHAMRRIWDRSAGRRGEAPLSWTIAPGLVDLAPGILNYYYTTATANDCFVGGPSGMGYVMPVNTLKEPGAPLGVHLSDPQRMEAYAKRSASYLRKADLRVLTIWDNATTAQREAYERHCKTLLGVTVQNFRDDPDVESSVANGRLRFERLVIPYASSSDHLRRSFDRQLAEWDGQSPTFIAYQANIWEELQPERLIDFMLATEKRDNRIEFVRADHYFELQRLARENPGHTP